MESSLVALIEQADALLDDAASCRFGVQPFAHSDDAASPPDDDLLRHVLLGLEQVVNRAQALQAEAMVQMRACARSADAAEARANGQDLWSRERREEFVPDEIAVLLGCTKVAAATRYDTACRAADLPAVRQAWRSGAIDARKVATICEQVSYLDPARAQPLAADAVDYATAPGRVRTATQLREWLRRRVIAENPDAAEHRRLRAMRDRRVVITPGDDGMSELWALLPSVQARQIQQTLSATAHQMTDDGRSMDQRRADALVDLLLGRGERAQVAVQVIVPADALTGVSTEPGVVPGLGPITSGQLETLLGCRQPDAAAGQGGGETACTASAPASVTFRRLLTDPTTGVLTDITEDRYRPSAALNRAVRARDVTCRFPGCRRSAAGPGTDLDHTIPWPTGPTSAANLAVLCRHHHRLKHSAGWQVTLDSSGAMTWTTPTGRRFSTDPWQYLSPEHQRDRDPPPND
jgi:hypothetical protein